MPAEVALIDEIVSRVLKELRTAEAAAPSVPAAAPAPVQSPIQKPANSEVAISAAIVTGELLEKSIGGAKKVRVAPKAILTPSARDIVRQRGLEIVRESAASAKAPTAAWRVLISSAAPQVASALDDLRSSGVGFDRQVSGTTEEAVTAAISALSRGEAKGIVVLTGSPELAACLANRSERVKAVALRDVALLGDIRRQFDPNLVAIDPGDRNTFELRQILKGVVAG